MKDKEDLQAGSVDGMNTEGRDTRYFGGRIDGNLEIR